MILFLASLAFAGESVLPLPVVGANMVLQDCTTKVVAAPWNSHRAGETLISNARAQAICLDAKGDVAIAEAKAKAIVTRSVAEATLIVNAGEAAKNGGSVSYDTRGSDTHLATGPAADWREYGTALSSSNGNNGVIGGMGVGYVDSQHAALYRLNAGQVGFGAHPAIPGAVVSPPPAAPAADPTTPVADGSALTTCQTGLKVASSKLAECRSGQ